MFVFCPVSLLTTIWLAEQSIRLWSAHLPRTLSPSRVYGTSSLPFLSRRRNDLSLHPDSLERTTGRTAHLMYRANSNLYSPVPEAT